MPAVLVVGVIWVLVAYLFETHQETCKNDEEVSTSRKILEIETEESSVGLLRTIRARSQPTERRTAYFPDFLLLSSLQSIWQFAAFVLPPSCQGLT